MEINIRQSGQVLIIEIAGDMDYYSAFRLREVVRKAAASNAARLVIDLKEVPYLDSSAMGTLVSVHSDLRKKGFFLQITGIQSGVKSALELTRLVGSLPIAPSLEEAVLRLVSAEPGSEPG
jgi:anti-anti-sigma factor